MLKFIQRTGCDIAQYREKYGNFFRAQFDSARKRMSTVIEVDGQRRLCIKGASEIILETCTHYLAEDGTRTPLDDTMRSNLAA